VLEQCNQLIAVVHAPAVLAIRTGRGLPAVRVDQRSITVNHADIGVLLEDGRGEPQKLGTKAVIRIDARDEPAARGAQRRLHRARVPLVRLIAQYTDSRIP
jgi:hypothetical protein